MSRRRRAIIVAEAENLGVDPNKGTVNTEKLHAAARLKRARAADGVTDTVPVEPPEEDDHDLEDREDIGDDVDDTPVAELEKAPDAESVLEAEPAKEVVTVKKKTAKKKTVKKTDKAD